MGVVEGVVIVAVIVDMMVVRKVGFVDCRLDSEEGEVEGN